MTEQDKLRRARMYMDQLSAGINPLDGTQIPPEDIAANERLQRCFAYVAETLTQILEGDPPFPAKEMRRKNPKRSRFYAECVELADFPFTDAPMPLGKLTAQINSMVQDEQQRRLPAQRVYQWLLAIGMVEKQITPDGGSMYIPTQEGADIGFGSETEDGKYGRRTVITCTREAQGFIVDNIEAISAHRNRKSEK